MTSMEAPILIMGRKSVRRIKVYIFCCVPKMRTRVPACEPKTDSDVLEHLRLGTAKVRDVLGPEVSITDREIEDSLWHYYYDVDKTVNYLISTTW